MIALTGLNNIQSSFVAPQPCLVSFRRPTNIKISHNLGAIFCTFYERIKKIHRILKILIAKCYSLDASFLPLSNFLFTDSKLDVFFYSESNSAECHYSKNPKYLT